MERDEENHHNAIRIVIQGHLPRAPDSTTIFLHGHPSTYDAASDLVAPPRASDDADQAVTSPTALSSMGFVAPDDVGQAGTTPLAHCSSDVSMGCSPSDVSMGCSPSDVSMGEDSSINTSFSATAVATVSLSEEMVALLLENLPIKDTFRFGYVLSNNWFDIWKSNPLVCHDVQFAQNSMLADGMVMNKKLSVSHSISMVLGIHPGPFKIVRVDRCSWTGGNAQMFLWLRQVSEKKLEVLFLAGRWPKKDKLDTLPSNIIHLTTLRKLYLSFLKIPDLSNAHELLFPQLDELQVAHCTFSDENLSIFLRNCRTLKTLSLGYINQYALSISSLSLREIMVWKSAIDFLCIGNCPKLSHIDQEIDFDGPICSRMQIRDTPMLHELTCLQLHRQTIEIYGYRVQMQMAEFPRCDSVRTLGLVVDFSARKQLEFLPSLLKCFPKLRHFFIVRVDSQEGVDMDWRDMFTGIECTQTSLRCFQIYECLHDTVEIELGDVFKALSRHPHRLKVELIKVN